MRITKINILTKQCLLLEKFVHFFKKRDRIFKCDIARDLKSLNILDWNGDAMNRDRSYTSTHHKFPYLSIKRQYYKIQYMAK